MVMIFKPGFSQYSSSIGHFFNTIVHHRVSTLISKAPCFLPNTLQVADPLGILIRVVKWLSRWPELVKRIETWPPMFQPALFHASLGSSIFPVVWLWTQDLFVPALFLYHLFLLCSTRNFFMLCLQEFIHQLTILSDIHCYIHGFLVLTWETISVSLLSELTSWHVIVTAF